VNCERAEKARTVADDMTDPDSKRKMLRIRVPFLPTSILLPQSGDERPYRTTASH
jgi:hypothetical protein